MSKHNVTAVALYANGVAFAAKAHIKKKRKGKMGISYIYHPINVANNLAKAGIDDIETLLAALLHDVIEDTPYTEDDIAREFGESVAKLVVGLTDLSNVPKSERRKEQIERAKSYDYRLANIRVSDKIDNLHSIVDLEAPWPKDKINEYVAFSKDIVEAIDSNLIHPEIMIEFESAYRKVMDYIT